MSSASNSLCTSQNSDGHNLELKIGSKNWIPFEAFWKSGSSPDISKCDSWGCFGSCLEKFEIDTGRLEAAMAQPFFMVEVELTHGADIFCLFFGMGGKCRLNEEE